MGKLFEKTNSSWVRYNAYEWKEADDGNTYITPKKDARPGIYNPLQDTEALVLDAVNIGRLGMGNKPDTEIQAAIMDFALKYGLLGLMTALPTTPQFMDYEAVYLPKNHFIKEESISTMDYLAYFFPFKKPDLVKRGVESMWNISNDRYMIALAMTMSDSPTAVNMSFQREYAERYDWLKQQFMDLAFTLTGCFLYYLDYDKMNDDQRGLYQKSMAAFGGIAPTYRSVLLDKPTIVWDFHSLLLVTQIMLSYMLTDDQKPLRLCKHCMKAFVASRPSMVFCSPQCKNQYNVYKNRAKNKQNEK